MIGGYLQQSFEETLGGGGAVVFEEFAEAFFYGHEELREARVGLMEGQEFKKELSDLLQNGKQRRGELLLGDLRVLEVRGWLIRRGG